MRKGLQKEKENKNKKERQERRGVRVGEDKASENTEEWRRFGGENGRGELKGQDEESWSGATYDWLSMEVDDQCLSVKLTQREQGSAICSKVNGKETRWGGEMCRSLERLEGERMRERS